MSYKKLFAMIFAASIFVGCEDSENSLSAESREQIQEVLNHETELEKDSSCTLNKELTEVKKKSRIYTFSVSCESVKFASPRYKDSEMVQVQNDLDYISNHVALVSKALKNNEIAGSDEGSDFESYYSLLTTMERRLESRNRVLRSALDSSEEALAAYTESVEALAVLGVSFEFRESTNTVAIAVERVIPETVDFDAPRADIEKALAEFAEYGNNTIELIREMEAFIEISKSFSDSKFGDSFEQRVASTESSIATSYLPTLKDNLEIIISMRDIYESQILIRGLQTMIDVSLALGEVREAIQKSDERDQSLDSSDQPITD